MLNLSRELLGNDNLYNNLLHRFNSKNLPNSLILNAQKGIGKTTFAFILLQEIICNFVTSNLINHHINLIYSNAHPNIKYVKKENNDKNNSLNSNISVDQIRILENFIYQSSLNKIPKFIIIDSADDLNLNASNALLKILEEPKKDTYFILISHQISKLIPTITSRCIRFYLEKISLDHFSKILLKYDPKIDNKEIDFLYDLSNGSPGISIEILSEDINDLYDSIIKILDDQDPLSSNVIHIVNKVAKFSNDKFKIFLLLLRHILLNITKFNLGISFMNKNLSYSLEEIIRIAKKFNFNKSMKILEYLNENENDLFNYNLDKKIFNINIFSHLKN